MIARKYRLNCLLALLLSACLCYAGPGRSYSSGGGHSYSAHSSSSHSSSGYSGSRSSGFSSSRSSGTSSTRNSSSSGSKSFGSGGGKSYSSGSSWNDSNRKGYGSSKTYTSGTGNTFSSSRNNKPSPSPATPRKDTADSSGFTFDTAAARARKEEASKEQFTKFKQSQSPPPISPNGSGNGSYRRPTYIPDTEIIRTRPVRVYNVYHYYDTRPWVTYRDPYSSFFWWWLLDRTLDDRAWWAYHHRYDMDPARYDALLATDAQLQARVAQLEAQQVARNPNYAPPGLDRDLMYSDQYINRAYNNRPTRSGEIAFWIFGVPLALGFCAFFIWLIWFKRWPTAA